MGRQDSDPTIRVKAIIPLGNGNVGILHGDFPRPGSSPDNQRRTYEDRLIELGITALGTPLTPSRLFRRSPSEIIYVTDPVQAKTGRPEVDDASGDASYRDGTMQIIELARQLGEMIGDAPIDEVDIVIPGRDGAPDQFISPGQQG